MPQPISLQRATELLAYIQRPEFSINDAAQLAAVDALYHEALIARRFERMASAEVTREMAELGGVQ